jgi:hypothetical protein
MHSHFVGIGLGILGVLIASLVCPPLFERIAGWPLLLAHFQPPPSESAIPLGYASLGTLFTIPVRLSASSQGLHITGSYLSPWRPKRSVFIPWLSVSQRGSGSLLLGSCFVIAMHPEIRIATGWRLAKRLRHHLAIGIAA